MSQVVAIESSVSAFLTSLQLEHLIELLEREQITMDILAEMGHEDLKQVGVSAYGFRHKILKGIATLRATTGQYEYRKLGQIDRYFETFCYFSLRFQILSNSFRPNQYFAIT